MDFSGILKYYNKEQKNVFTGFIIQLPLIFTLLYLYIPQFKELEIYLQIIFSSAASILSIYYSFMMLILCQILTKKEYNANIILPILPMLLASFLLIKDPEQYLLGYEHVLQVYTNCSAFFLALLALFLGNVKNMTKSFMDNILVNKLYIFLLLST